ISFRARITLTAAAAVAVVAIVGSALAFVLVRNELTSNLDNQLRGLAQEVESGQLRLHHITLPTQAYGAAQGYFQLVLSDGTPQLLGDESGAPIPVSANVRNTARGARQSSFFQDATVSGRHMRVLTNPVTLTDPLSGTTEPAALMVALPLHDVDSVLHRLGWILFFVALGGTGIAGILGFAVSRAALAPVRRLTTTTEEISATRDLSRRVEEGGSDELGRLGTSFNTMLAALQESQQAQRQLVADASHELRTPLTSLRTNVELLARGTLPEEERKKAFVDVSTQLEELTVLVTDVVDLAREGEPERLVEDVRLDLLVGDAVERARLHTPRIRFDAQLGESMVRGVPDRIFRAVANVIDNAAKFSPPGGTVEVKVADGEVAVEDHGPGIAAEDLPHVFDRFYRSPSARGTPGSGLGLAIVRQVVESHGGTVSAGPANGGGTLVRLAFPPEPVGSS
ncbi:MAG TPA: HAMP domain-containing sensor histidine kinase, partial [Gaiellaceae bacterium]|nr:HAMP domain-containing sensor histidine kinase [Gaiellaceae bacterium]